MNNSDKYSDEYFEKLTKELLENDLEETSGKLEEESGYAVEPDYSDEYKRFINKLAGKKIYDTKKKRGRKLFVGAALCACFIIILSISSVADIRNIIKNLFITFNEDSTHITEYDMNQDYSLYTIPESWEYIYVPEYLPGGYTVAGLESDDKEIHIVFTNSDEESIEYDLYRDIDIDFDEYENIGYNGKNIYYAENDGKKTAVYKVTDMYIKVSSEYANMDEIMQIIKNVQILGR